MCVCTCRYYLLNLPALFLLLCSYAYTRSQRVSALLTLCCLFSPACIAHLVGADNNPCQGKLSLQSPLDTTPTDYCCPGTERPVGRSRLVNDDYVFSCECWTEEEVICIAHLVGADDNPCQGKLSLQSPLDTTPTDYCCPGTERPVGRSRLVNDDYVFSCECWTEEEYCAKYFCF
ncbi:hypothetical protein ElyMa_004615400 [Elysia marginata]|uniref:VWFC domain-containing protein n=1 Tax=Elysia marginata TaxID=1093978 RepID=A0AAV4HYB2_9GAST|nr:hypothetical protein ElyMa_004615400 [Elysia marginata]